MLLLCLAWLGWPASQGMGDSRTYDQSGYRHGHNCYGTDQAVMAMPDYLSLMIQPCRRLSMDSAMPSRLMMKPADPAGEGLLKEENKSQANKLYIHDGQSDFD